MPKRDCSDELECRMRKKKASKADASRLSTKKRDQGLPV